MTVKEPLSKYDPDGRRLPIKLDSTSNGEFAPLPLPRAIRLANRLARERADGNARRAGLRRREFMTSACGAATTLLAVNAVYGERQPGGFYDLPPDSEVDPALAADKLAGTEFIFDVQGHYVDPNGNWLKGFSESDRPFGFIEKTKCPLAKQPGRFGHLQCIGPEEFVKDVFLDSDTDMMVLSFAPSLREAESLTIEEAAATREIVEKMEGSHRLILHGRVNPNQDGDLQSMEELAERWQVKAWKTYTQWGPENRGFFLTDEPGIAMIEKARALGIRNICVHKGLPLPFAERSYEHSLCNDIGVVAARYPDVNFLVYHSGYVPGQAEGPYDPVRNEGIDSLVKSVLENDIPPNSNVYAELGTTWRTLMQDPHSAAHGLGKLFKYVGEDRVLWGTDSIWYGSPQDQIQAFRAFQIAPELREKHGYPEITPALRAKVFGLNATRPYGISDAEVVRRARSDAVSNRRTAYREHADPSFQTYGPKTRREFLKLLSLGG
jgi:predicted TIM-barrel fold metal-dependent hydrolase